MGDRSQRPRGSVKSAARHRALIGGKSVPLMPVLGYTRLLMDEPHVRSPLNCVGARRKVDETPLPTRNIGKLFESCPAYLQEADKGIATDTYLDV